MTSKRLLSALACAAALAACGGDDAQPGSSGLKKLKVGVIPIADSRRDPTVAKRPAVVGQTCCTAHSL